MFKLERLFFMAAGSLSTLLIIFIFSVAKADNPVLTATPAPCVEISAGNPSPDTMGMLKAEIREANGVRELEPLENDLPLNQLPNGVYGFTVPWIINTDPTGVVGGTGADRINLNRSSFGTLVMEVHKADDGTVYIIGFVSGEDYKKLTDSEKGAEIEFTMLFTPYEDYDRVIAIPLSSIVYSDNRHIETDTDFFYANDMRVLIGN